MRNQVAKQFVQRVLSVICGISFIAGFVAIIPTVAQAAGGTCFVYGYVKSGDGTGMPNVRVTLEGPANFYVDSVLTLSTAVGDPYHGWYQFGTIPCPPPFPSSLNSSYRVTVACPQGMTASQILQNITLPKRYTSKMVPTFTCN